MRGLPVAVLLVAAALSGAAGSAAGTGTDRTSPTARDVVAKLRAAGLPIGRFKVYTRASDGTRLLGRPGQYTGKVSFRDRRIVDGGGGFAVSSGGSVELFATEAAAKRRFAYVAAIFNSASAAIPSEYDYVEGKAFLRLSQRLTPAQAKRYEAAFRRLF